MNFFRKLLGNQKTPIQNEFSQEDFEINFELKLKGLENVLGDMHELVGHAIIPFDVGGTVDMYYFSKHIEGTGFATMELLKPDGTGPLENRLGTYELIAFTKYDIDADDETTVLFRKIERQACSFLTAISRFSSQAILNPNETIEIPNLDDDEDTCLIFDRYTPNDAKFFIGKREHHLLLCMQIFRSEMVFARLNGSEELFKILKAKQIYPYSDLDREPAV